jgi:pectate lyase
MRLLYIHGFNGVVADSDGDAEIVIITIHHQWFPNNIRGEIRIRKKTIHHVNNVFIAY